MDSLGRTELILRIEQAFAVRLPPDTLAEADTVADLLAAISKSAPRTREVHVSVQSPVATSIVDAPEHAKTLVEAWIGMSTAILIVSISRCWKTKIPSSA